MRAVHDGNAQNVRDAARHGVRIELDTEERTVDPPPDLERALRAAPPAWERWGQMSYTHQREDVEAIEEAKATGRLVRYQPVPPEVYRGLGFPGADDLGNMLPFKRDFNDYYTGARDVERTRALNPRLQSFDEWLERNGGTIPIPE